MIDSFLNVVAISVSMYKIIEYVKNSSSINIQNQSVHSILSSILL